MILKYQKETTVWAVQKTRSLMRMRGAPKGDDAAEIHAKAVLRIAHPQLVFLRCLEIDFPEARLMDLLRLLPEESVKYAAEDSALGRALTAKMPPRSWVKNPSGEIPDVFIRGALRLPVEELEKIEVTSAKIKPMDWLVETAMDRGIWFLSPPELRAIFVTRMPTADGENTIIESSFKKE